ncbi:MAG: 16S rRNA (uracil(1498)-N(3))-methyltransferase [Defluviitaleaceae bacterium]|nr:16S rRNA (uracil(1498)-N(3))-methyltransferase [Defluviitaleaceae bacterium]
MMRFFIDASPNIDGRLLLSGEDFDHLRVLRPKIGEVVELCNPTTQVVYQSELTAMTKQDAQVTIVAKRRGNSEPVCKITLFQAIPKFDKMELIVKKCIELGALEIVPVFTARTQTHPANAGIKAKRWQKIAKSAAQQSNRDIIPDVSNIMTFKDALDSLSRFDHVFVANENETKLNASEAFKEVSGQNVCVFIGPEGSFEDEEIQALRGLGAESISLGKRILRVETAAFASVILLLSARGEL